MVKRKVGILVFTDMLKKRSTRKTSYFNSMKYNGFNYIINEIDENENDIKYISLKEINECDYVLVSMTSFMDIKNFINERNQTKKGKAKIIVGGAGVNNIKLYSDLIDYACLGRGEGIINGLLNGVEYPNVWEAKKDPNIKNKYTVGGAKLLIGNEKSVGCKKKCSFCQYSWKNKHYSGLSGGGYESGYNEYEDYFKTFNWDKAKRHAVTALDGVDEKTRRIVNKPISEAEVLEKIKEAYTQTTENRLSLKIYMIIGYPWDNRKSAELSELKRALRQADRKKKTHDIKLFFLFTHFVPMQLTPMYYMPLSLTDYRKELIRKRNYMIYQGVNINAYVSSWITTPPTAFDQLYIERAEKKDYESYINIFNTKKYEKLSVYNKIKVIKEYARKGLYERNEKIGVDYILPAYNYLKASKCMMKRERAIQ